MPDDFRIPWWLRQLPDLWPRDTPTIPEQLRCPPGFHRGRPGEGCVPDAPPPPPPSTEPGTLTEVDEGFVAPTPPPRVVPRPPKVPAPLPPAPPGPTVVDRSTGRYFPGRGSPTPTTVGLLLSVLGTLVFGPYFTSSDRAYREELERRTLPGPPRRGRPRRVESTTEPEVNCTLNPLHPNCWQTLPRAPGWWMPAPTRRTPRVSTPGQRPRTVPTGPSPLPQPRTRVPTVPAPSPAGWLLGDPIPGPGYDPFTYTPAPAPAPRAAPRPGTRRRPRVAFPLPFGDPGLPGSVARPIPRRVTQPLTPQPLPRPRLPPAPTLTPLQDPVLQAQPQPLRKPTSANPCTTERTARRRRQRECKQYTTKTIRVCADK